MLYWIKHAWFTLGLVIIILAGYGGSKSASFDTASLTLQSGDGEKTALIANNVSDFVLSYEVDVKYREGSVYFRTSQDMSNCYGIVFCPFDNQGANPGIYLVIRMNGLEQSLDAFQNGFPRTSGQAHFEITVKKDTIIVRENNKIVLQAQDTQFNKGNLVWRVYGDSIYPAEAEFKIIQFQPAYGTTWDLAAAWSEIPNPNGVWSYLNSAGRSVG
jgi:hypothetical protein